MKTTLKYLALAVVIAVTLTSCSSGSKTSSASADDQFQNLTQLTFHEQDDYEPNATQDGSRLIFVSERDGDRNVYMKSVGARSVIKKTSHPGSDINPVFSPDGDRFAFASNRNGNYDIFVMNSNSGTAKMQITDSDFNEVYPNWSPDGQSIAFSQFSTVDGKWYIWIKNVETGQLIQLGAGLMPKFSPDGTALLYKKAGPDGYYELWMTGIDGENNTQIVSNENWGIGTFCWSKNGDNIMFSTSKEARLSDGGYEYGQRYGGRKSRNDLWMVRINGAGMTEVTADRANNVDPWWSQDEVFFVSDRDGDVNIWRFDMQPAIGSAAP